MRLLNHYGGLTISPASHGSMAAPTTHAHPGAAAHSTLCQRHHAGQIETVEGDGNNINVIHRFQYIHNITDCSLGGTSTLTGATGENIDLSGGSVFPASASSTR